MSRQLFGVVVGTLALLIHAGFKALEARAGA